VRTDPSVVLHGASPARRKKLSKTTILATVAMVLLVGCVAGIIVLTFTD